MGNLSKTRKLYRELFEKTPRFETSVHAALNRIGFTQEFIEATRERAFSKPKVIKDNIWGMVEVDGEAVRILDSPLLQRLRAVKQLGLGYLTYPSAQHSRFAHSLGMFSVVSSFLTASARPGPARFAGYHRHRPDADERRLLLHTALLHDTGHTPFSHVTEKILEHAEHDFFVGPLSVSDFLSLFEDHIGKHVKLSEALSAVMIMAPRFQQFYSECVAPYADRSACYAMACFVCGLSGKDDMPGLADIISGDAIDADKVDYIQRDADACGISSGIDVHRLFLQSSFVEISPTDLNKLLDAETSSPQTHFIVNSSGADTIEEVISARAALYQRVYLHQVTRNAERLMTRALLHAARGKSSATTIWRDALQLWSMNDESFLGKLSRHKAPEVSRLADQLGRRQLPKRALVLNGDTVQPTIDLDDFFADIDPRVVEQLQKETSGVVLDALRARALYGKDLVELESLIDSECRTLAKVLADDGAWQRPRGSPDISIVTIPHTEPSRNDVLVSLGGRLCRLSDLLTHSERMDAADFIHARGYVVASEPWRAIAAVAATKVLCTRQFREAGRASFSPFEGAPTYNVRLGGRVTLRIQEAARRAGVDSEDISDVLERARDAGYFDEQPYLLAHSSDLAPKIAASLRDFMGEGHWQVTESSCNHFVSQFPRNLRDECESMLSEIVHIGRTKTIELLLPKIAESVPKNGRLLVTNFSPDSGSLVRSWLERELTGWAKGRPIVFRKSIRDAFDDCTPKDVIMLCDDNVSSGSQAQCQFWAWFGKPRSEWPPEQQNERGIESALLSPRDQKLLRRMPIILGIAAGIGSSAAAKRLKKIKNEYEMASLSLVVGREFPAHQLNVSPELKTYLSDVGRDLIADSRFSSPFASLQQKQKNACTADALGYGNVAGLLCTADSVPTSTVTALWCPGMTKAGAWTPLLLRRGYLGRFVVS